MAKTITLTVGSGDWDGHAGGWNVPLLDLPGATLESVLRDGKRAGPDDYTVEGTFVRWRGDDDLRDARLAIKLKRDLATEVPELEKAKLDLEQKKLALEGSKAKWQMAAAVLALLGGLVGNLLPKPGSKTEATPPAASSIAGHPSLPMPHETLDDCRTALAQLEAVAVDTSASAESVRKMVEDGIKPCKTLVRRAR